VIIQDNEAASQVSGLPAALLSLPRWLDCPSLGFIPVISQGNLAALFIVGSRNNGGLTPTSLRVHASLAEMASIALDKVHAVDNMEKRLTVLQTLDSVSKTISMETDLDNLFLVTHQQVVNVMGDINFLVALYDEKTNSIEIPYAFEEGNTLSLPTIPLGQGLTSIIIHTRQPLLLVEDTERRAAELGARVYGAAAKSWLGVPLLVAGDILGAIVVQDPEHEHRFDEDDQRLLTNLATQVAITVRNVRLLQETRRNAERERTVTDITTQLWASTNTDTILRTAIQELSSKLGASRGVIKLEIEEPNAGYPD
jgi:GAF domain-containing protein